MLDVTTLSSFLLCFLTDMIFLECKFQEGPEDSIIFAQVLFYITLLKDETS